MERLYQQYRDRDVEVVLLYCREPHPGKRYPQPATYEQRLAYAREFAQMHHVTHPIWVDEMDNPVRQIYGSRPNMVYIVDKRGLIVYKASWTRADDIETALASLWEREQAHELQVRLQVVYSERAVFRPVQEALQIEQVGLPIYEDEPEGAEHMYGKEYADLMRQRARSPQQ